MRNFALGALCMLTAALSNAQDTFRLPGLIGDHMVLQSGGARVWGWDVPLRDITVQLEGKTFRGKSDARGAWKVELPGLQPGGPFELSIQGSRSVTLRDVLVGEVWLGSGQSNMEFYVKDSLGGAKTVAQAKDPSLRLFLQSRAMALKPSRETQGAWVVCDPTTVGRFSAVAYFFGRELRKDLKVPVGLIAASWGGSYIESWMPEETLARLPQTRGLLAAWKKQTAASRKVWSQGLHPEMKLCSVRFLPKDPKQEPLTVRLAPPREGNGPALGGVWKGEAKEGSRIEFTGLSEKGPRGAAVGCLSGHMEGGAWGFVSTLFKPNGMPVDLSPYRALEFMAKGSGEYFIFLPQPSVQDSCYWSSQPFKVTKSWKTYRIHFDQLKQDAWGKPTPFTQDAIQRLAFGAVSPALSNLPDVLFNAMIAPATPARIRGVLWYQGEANEWAAKEYHVLLPNLIQAWREAWGEPEMPFLICQLPEFRTKAKGPVEENWPVIREAQKEAEKLPGVETAVLLGLGEANDIHPKNKADVGRRLEKIALHRVYGKDVEWTGPVFDTFSVEGPKVRVRFKHAEKGLRTTGGAPQGFEVAGEDGKFHWARAMIEKDSVLVWSEEVPMPVRVRYAWADNPVANVTGKNGLPLAPFRTGETR